MRRFLILLTLLLCGIPTYSQRLAQRGQVLERVYASITDRDEAVVWVYFTDKGAGAEQRLGAPQESFLTPRAIQRRTKVLGTSSVVDIQDVPVDASYLQRVAQIVKKIRHEAKWFNAVSAVATKEQIEMLRQLPFVREVELVARLRKPQHDIEHERSDQTPPPPMEGMTTPLYNYGNSLFQNQQINTVAVHNLGITGQGVLVGVLDDGFPNLNHPALATRPIVAGYDFIFNTPVLGTLDAHGQETFSTIGGYAEGSHIGPAFGASFVLAVTEDIRSETPIEEDNWVRGIIWADSIGIDVSTTSLGYDTFDSPWPGYTWQEMNGTTAVITRAADRAAAMGIVVVNSAGNSGDNASHNTLGAPADGFNVITAGAVTSTGARASFSSVGPTADGRIKPDVMALGSGVQVAYGSSGYSSASGTSFSCPLSAGVAALVLSGNLGFNLTPFQVREAMRQTASRASTPDRQFGWGILNALNAVNYAWIEHTPLTNTEDTTARTVVVRLKSRVALVGDSTRVWYGIGGSFTGSVPLTPTGSPNEYSAQIPYLGTGATVTYYLQAKNSNVTTRSPLTGSYSYQIGADAAGPTIVHRQLGNQSINSWPPRIAAVVTDLSGVDTVKLQYSLNGVPQTPIRLSLADGSYSDTLHLSRSQVRPGDTIAYRIIATDRSRLHNASTYPPAGNVVLALLNYYNLNATFDEASANYAGTNDWQWGASTGPSPRPHSGLRCWGTVLGGNYTQGPRLSSLTTPRYRVFSNRAMISFWHWHEIQSRMDGGNVKISVNGAPFQLLRPVGDYPTQSIYNGFGNPLAGQPGYSSVGGTSWSKVNLDLAGIANEGDSVALRFDFGADNSIQYRGWYIDDVTSDGVAGPAPLTNPTLGVDRDSVNIGNVAIGTTDSSQSIVVRNLGSTPLNVTNISITNPSFHVNRTVFTLNSLDTVRVKLYFSASAPGGIRTATLTFLSNDAAPPAVRLFATAVGVARVVATPDTFYFARPPGPDTTRTTFKLTNPGTDTLRFRIDETMGGMAEPSIRRSTTQQESYDAPKGAADPTPGEQSPMGSGGPDAFGYRWIDSDETGGPQFNWTDIRTLGTQITGWMGSADDGYASVSLPFSFPLYGGTISSSINVCTNGFLSTSTSNSYSNTAIPTSAEPNNALYAFWDDLNLTNQGAVHYFNDAANNRFIVQYTGAARFGGTGDSLTFQVIIRPNGSILYQYLRMLSPTLNSATIGIENSTGTIALQTVSSSAYVHDGLAVLFTSDVLPWASVSPTSGTIAPGDSTLIQLRVHPAGLAANTLYTGRLRITGNSPDIVQVRLGLSTSGGTGVNGVSGIPASFALEQNYPNPFNPSTTIQLSIPEQANVTLRVYDLLGREVRTLVSGDKQAGYIKIVWDGRNDKGSTVASGIYMYRFEATGASGRQFTSLKKAVMLK